MQPFIMQVHHTGQASFFDTRLGTGIEIAAFVGVPITLFTHIGLGLVLWQAALIGLVIGALVANSFMSPNASLP